MTNTGVSTPATEPADPAVRRGGADGFYPSYWRSLDYFNLARLSVAAVLALIALLFADSGLLGSIAAGRFRITALAYLMLAAFFVLSIRARWPAFKSQVSAHILTDIVLIVALMSAAGGVRSGLGLVLMVSLASAGLTGSLRRVLFFASLAGLAVIASSLAEIFAGDANMDALFQSGLLAAGYFATGSLAHALTQRALISERLAEAREREAASLARINQIVIDDMPDGMVVVDAEGRVRHCNARARALSGRTGIEDLRMCGLEDFHRELAQAYRDWREGKGPTHVILAGKDGLASLEARILTVESDARSGAAGAVIVIEDLSRAEARARQIKLAALGRLTANIAHEIRNPLSAISHAAQLLAEEPEAGPTQGRLIGIIGDNTRRLDRMVRDVLELSRRDRAQPEVVRLDAWLEGFIAEYCQTEGLSREGIVVWAEPATLCFDRGHLHQIMWNLVRNAWRHGSQGKGCVRVSAHGSGHHAEVRVEDDGAGIREEHRAHLFEPFFTTDSRGTGLGLYISRELAQANDADMSLCGASDPGWPGACFVLHGRATC